MNDAPEEYELAERSSMKTPETPTPQSDSGARADVLLSEACDCLSAPRHDRVPLRTDYLCRVLRLQTRTRRGGVCWGGRTRERARPGGIYMAGWGVFGAGANHPRRGDALPQLHACCTTLRAGAFWYRRGQWR